MQNFRSARLLTTLAGSASLAALGVSQPVMAQQSAQSDQPSASSGSGLEEIVVTARRREEKAQSVPIAINTFSSQTMSDQHITMIADIERFIPGLTIANQSFVPVFLWFRAVPTGLAAYFAEVPITLAGSAAYFDLGNIQVLKGPQGTLFGISTNGGAMIFSPKMPTNNFEGSFESEVGDYGHYDLKAIVNVPIVQDKFLVRLGAERSHTDGYSYVIATKQWLNDINYNIYRLTTTVRPFDDLQNDTLINWYDAKDNNGVTAYAYTLNPKGSLPTRFGLPAVQAAFDLQHNVLAKNYAVLGNNVPNFRSGWQMNVSNVTRYDVNDNLTVKNILGYQEIQAGPAQGDGDNFLGLPCNIVQSVNPGGKYGACDHSFTPASGPQVNYTEELQALGKIFNDKLSYTLGTFQAWTGYRSPHNLSTSVSNAGQTVTLSSAPGTSSATTYTSHAYYGQGTYDLGDFLDGLSLTGGYRYTMDRVYSYIASFNSVTFAPAATNGGYGGKYSAGSYTMSLDWQINPTTMIFVTNSKGYSKGGINPSPFVPANYQTFQPESLDNVEVGIKTDQEFYGVKTRTNVSAFYGFYDQVQTILSFVNPANGIAVAPTANAATAHIQGFEWDFTVVPSDEWTLTFNGGYIHPTYDKYVNPQGVNVVDSSFTYTPKWKYNVGATYNLPIDESLGRASLGFLVSYSSTKYDIAAYLPAAPGNVDPPYYNVNVNLNWHEFLGRPGLDARAYVTNLAKNRWYDGGGGSYGSSGIQGLNQAPPREYAFALKYSFGP